MCPSTHPGDVGVRCAKLDDNHRLCLGWSVDEGGMVNWENARHKPLPTTPRAQVADKVADMATRVAPAPSALDQPQSRARAAASWTDAERALVYQTILDVAAAKKFFTTDDVWAELGDEVPANRGIGVLLRRAQKNNRILPTTDQAFSQRSDRQDHDHGRYLRVWKSADVI